MATENEIELARALAALTSSHIAGMMTLGVTNDPAAVLGVRNAAGATVRMAELVGDEAAILMAKQALHFVEATPGWQHRHDATH